MTAKQQINLAPQKSKRAFWPCQVRADYHFCPRVGKLQTLRQEEGCIFFFIVLEVQKERLPSRQPCWLLEPFQEAVDAALSGHKNTSPERRWAKSLARQGRL